MTFLGRSTSPDPAALAASQPTPGGPAAATLRDVVRSFFYHRRAVTIAFLIPVAAGLGAAVLTQTTFVAEARLLVLPGGEYSYRPQVGQAMPEATLGSAQIVQSEVEILSDTSLHARALEAIGPAKVLGDYDADAPNAMARAVRAVDGDLKISTVPLTNAITISFRNRDPVMAAQYTNTLVRLYLQQRPEVYQRSSARTLTEQRDQFSARLRDAEEELARFGELHKITNLDDQTALLLRQQIDLQQQQRTLEGRISGTGAQAAQLRQQLARTPRQALQYSEQSRTVGSGVTEGELGKLQARRQEMAQNYRPDSLPVQDINRQIANLQAQIARTPGRDVSGGRSGPNPLYDSLASQAANLEAERQGLQATLAGVTAAVAQTQARLSELNQYGQEYRALKRGRDVLEQTFQTFSRNSEEAQLNEALERTREANVRVVQEAQPPPTGTSMRRVIMFAGVFVGLVAAVATLLVLSGLRQVLLDAADAERRLQLPVLATVAERGRRFRLRTAPPGVRAA